MVSTWYLELVSLDETRLTDTHSCPGISFVSLGDTSKQLSCSPVPITSWVSGQRYGRWETLEELVTEPASKEL